VNSFLVIARVGAHNLLRYFEGIHLILVLDYRSLIYVARTMEGITSGEI
jgi:hypothetical protein